MKLFHVQCAIHLESLFHLVLEPLPLFFFLEQLFILVLDQTQIVDAVFLLLLLSNDLDLVLLGVHTLISPQILDGGFDLL